MSLQFTPARQSLTGTTVLMACACGAGVGSAKLITMAGMTATAQITHTLMLSIGALLVVSGLWKINRRSGAIAAAALATLAAGAALTPPLMMSSARTPWASPQVSGAVLYLIFGAALAYAFWLAFPNPRPGATATALAGTAVASGCSCCMVTGAVAGLAVTAGGSKGLFLSNPVVFFSGIALAAVGLAMLRGVRPLPWLIAGAVVTRWGGNALGLLGDWMVGDVNLRFIPGYLIYLIGAGLVMTAWAVAYEPRQIRGSEQPSGVVVEPALQRT